MPTDQLFIPEKIKVGFQARKGTYTGKLAYVIYFDKKGKLRKETSWKNWRSDKIEPLELTNEPTEGFVLNKGVGGARQSYGWNARNEYIRVYDPRDFEFEISVANLLFILRECDCNKGKGLEGKFIYSWEGKNLVLLPVGSKEYKNSQEFTDLTDKKVKIRELIEGATYITKHQKDLVYVGRFPYHFVVNKDRYYSYKEKRDAKGICRKFVFWNGESFEIYDNVQKLAVLKSDVHPPDYAELVAKYHKSANGTKVVKLFTKIKKTKPKRSYWYDNNDWWFEESDGVFIGCDTQYINVYKDGNTEKKIDYVSLNSKIFLDDGILVSQSYNFIAHSPNTQPPKDYWGQRMYNNPLYNKWIEPTNLELWAELESGTTVKFNSLSTNEG